MTRVLLALCAACVVACASQPAVITTYAKHYSDAARVHRNKRYHPDALNVAVGWRWLYGHTLELQHGFMQVTVRATDVMNARYDCIDSVLHIDASPRVMRALNIKGRSHITVRLVK